MSLLKREIRPAIAIPVVLIVIGVVAFLYINAALSYSPVHAAMAASCVSRLKQLALAHTMYATDYDETAMPAENWHGKLEPYTKNLDLFRCPKAVRDSGEDSFGYAYNTALSRVKLPGEDKREETILFFDSSVLTTNAIGGNAIVAKPSRHGGRNGYAYLNGKGRMVKDGAHPGSWTLSPTR